MKKITIKVGIIYIFLCFLNIAFFITMIFENQTDLIAENSKFRATEITEKLLSPIHTIAEETLLNKDKYQTEKDVIDSLKKILDPILNNYLLFDDMGTILGQKNQVKSSEIEMEDLKRGLTASSAKNLSGKEFSLHLSKNEVSFYIPFYSIQTQNITIFYIMELSGIDNKMKYLYRQAALVIIVLILTHSLIGWLLSKIIVKPLMKLKEKTDEFSNGNFRARVTIKGNDEIALVASTFNTMATSVESFIAKLKEQNDTINMELEVAGQVQKAIYPQLRQNEFFHIAVYDRPFEMVSGDFHDFLKLANNKFGFFIADVSGHGVPAALITMKIKDLLSASASNFQDPAILLKFFNLSFGDLMERFSSYFTAYYLIYDLANKTLSYSCAGHPSPIIIKRSGELIKLELDGFVIGVSKEFSHLFQSACIALETGDRIVIFTDGITESRAPDGSFLGEKGLMELLERCLKAEETANNQKEKDIETFLDPSKKLNNLLEQVIEEVRKFTDNKEQKDDETLIIIEVK